MADHFCQLRLPLSSAIVRLWLPDTLLAMMAVSYPFVVL